MVAMTLDLLVTILTYKVFMNKTNIFWKFFSSVKLALFTLGCLAITSILGTVIPQKEAVEFYVKNYGVKTAQFFQILDIPEMYTSWWFLSLLGLLTANLIICSIDRFPTVWRQITRDNLEIPIHRIEKNRLSATRTTTNTLQATTDILLSLLPRKGWKADIRQRDEATLLFAQKAPWSRIGVYLVHLSILVIFAGAIYGQLTGFKGSIMLPELQSSDKVYTFENDQAIDLGFTVRCERFEIEFYSNNMPKEYRSRLTILENDTLVLQKDIEVNHPLRYKGITFYQSSYQGFSDFLFTVTPEDDQSHNFTGQYQKEIIWEENNIRFGIINMEAIRDRVVRMKIWFNDSKGASSEFWVNSGEQVKIERPDATYLFSAKQRYATGLQVAKDPGVWLVYLGCGLMLLGLYIAFFTSHRRLWVILRENDGSTTIDIKGSANKNKAGFEKQFYEIADTIEQKTASD